MLTTVPCTECSGHFVVHTMDLHQDYVCGMCNVPSRAGKTRKNCAPVTASAPAAAPVKAPRDDRALDAAFARLGTSTRPLRKAA
jgi:flagellar transcriptional activator FlhC